MSVKRPTEEGNDQKYGHDRKKQKVATARIIAFQPAGRQVAEPLRILNSLTGLPTTLDVEKFAEARAFEIHAMEEAMKNAKSASTQRAWQVLPRNLRRRAASHDVRRVPLRLREKARTEMDPSKKKSLAKTLFKAGRTKQSSRTEKFRERRRNNYWLETHLWHAKRMHMEDLWGYRLAIQPTEKSFRSSHRASVRGSIIHDASYYSLIEISGLAEHLEQILDMCNDPQGVTLGSPRYTNGARIAETHFYESGWYPYAYIGPVTIIWQPLSAEMASARDRLSTPKPDSGKDAEGTQPHRRTVWIRTHPLIHEKVFDALKFATTKLLENTPQPGNAEAEVELSDLRDQVNVFEIMGPKANQVIHGAVKPASEDKREELKKFWSSLRNVQTTGSLPRGMVIGLKAMDPRLRFPKNSKPSDQNEEETQPIPIIPSASLARSGIWDERLRLSLKVPRYKKSDLDDRRSQNLIPGTPLSALRQDDRIPVLLIQRSIESNSEQSEAVHGWTIIIPAGWAMAFWSSLVYTGTRVGGQREREAQTFEAGTAYFPRDFPTTSEYEIFSERQKEDNEAKWQRKPPAKRVNYEKLGVRSPWKADWRAVLGSKGNKSITARGIKESAAPAPCEDSDTTMDQVYELHPWMLRGPDVASILETISKYINPVEALYSKINWLRAKRGFDSLPPDIPAEGLLKACLVSVQVKVCGRGTPEELAMICLPTSDELRAWAKGNQTGRFDPPESLIEWKEGCGKVQADIIGYVTTGQVSLSRGKGFAIGAVSLEHFLSLKQHCSQLFPNKTAHDDCFVKIRNRDSYHDRMAKIKVLLD